MKANKIFSSIFSDTVRGKLLTELYSKRCPDIVKLSAISSKLAIAYAFLYVLNEHDESIIVLNDLANQVLLGLNEEPIMDLAILGTSTYRAMEVISDKGVMNELLISIVDENQFRIDDGGLLHDIKPGVGGPNWLTAG